MKSNTCYKQKYEDALEKMKSLMRGEYPEWSSEVQKIAEFVFPELQYDKIMADFLIKFFKRCKTAKIYCGLEYPTIDKIISWLEKQGKETSLTTED